MPLIIILNYLKKSKRDIIKKMYACISSEKKNSILLRGFFFFLQKMKFNSYSKDFQSHSKTELPWQCKSTTRRWKTKCDYACACAQT